MSFRALTGRISYARRLTGSAMDRLVRLADAVRPLGEALPGLRFPSCESASSERHLHERRQACMFSAFLWPSSGRLVLLLLVLLLTSCRVTASDGQPVPIETALQVIESHENNCRSAKWSVEATSGRLSNPSDLDSFILDSGPNRGTTVFDPGTGRYRYECASVAKWVDGIAPHIGKRSGFSFDGTSERSYDRSLPGDKLPSPLDRTAPGEGSITAEHPGAFVKKWGWNSGIDFMPPNFLGLKLSELLRRGIRAGKPPVVTQNEAGPWQIKTNAPERPQDELILEYDPTKGLVTGGTQLGLKNSQWIPWQRFVLSVEEVKPGLWAPRQVDVVNLFDKQSARLRFSDIHLNEPVADDAFRLPFPPGTAVTDELEGKYYVVGAGPVDDQKAVRDFIERYGLTSDTKPGWKKWMVLAGLCVAAVMLAGFVVRRWRLKSVAHSALLASTLGVIATPYAQAGFPAAPAAIPGGTATPGPPISQCGFNVTVFALEYFKVPYQVGPVWRALKPDHAGISMGDVRAVLEAHGLQVAARRKVSMQGLSRWLKPGRLAIFPVRNTAGTDHYVLAMDSKHGQVLVDPPLGLCPLKADSHGGPLAAFDGLCLLVEAAPKGEGTQAQRLTISPATLDFGKFILNGPQNSVPALREMTLQNRGATALLITEVGVPCGCIHTGIEPCLLSPGESRTFPIRVIPGAWGSGHRVMPIELVFADSSRASIPLVAEGVTVQQVQKLTAQPEIVRVDLGALPSTTQVIERTVSLTHEPSAGASLTVTSKAEWVGAELRSVDASHTSLRLRIDPRVSLQGRSRIGDVSVASRREEPPLRVQVLLFRAPSVRVLPPSLVISRRGTPPAAGSPAARILASETAPNARLTAVRAWSEPPGLKVTVRPRGEHEIGLEIASDPKCRPGYYVVKCALRGNADAEEIASLVVKVRD